MKHLGWLPLCLIVLLGAGVGSAVDAVLNLGDTFFGEISSPGDVDVLRFSAIAGTRVTVEVEALELDDGDDDDDSSDDDDDGGSDDDDDGGSDDDDDGGSDDDDDGNNIQLFGSSATLRPQIQIVDLSTGEVLADKTADDDEVRVKKLKLPSTGPYEIRILGADGTTGPYETETDRKLGNDILKFSYKDEVPGGETMFYEFDALTGFLLEEAKFKALSPALVDNPTLFAPSGAKISLTGFIDDDSDFHEIEIEDVPLPEIGTYTLCIDNVGDTGKIKTKIRLEEDDPDEQDIYEEN